VGCPHHDLLTGGRGLWFDLFADLDGQGVDFLALFRSHNWLDFDEAFFGAHIALLGCDAEPCECLVLFVFIRVVRADREA